MSYGLERLETLPLSVRLMKEIHEKLMQGSRGQEKSPGELRTSQNWIGGTRPGNGRLGRLLIPFILCMEGVMKEPLLYLSLYFKEHKQTYYQHLQSVRTEGKWDNWISFFLDGVTYTSNQAYQTANQILQLFNRDQQIIQQSGSSSQALIIIFNYLQTNPLTNTANIKKHCEVSLPTVLRSLKTLEELGVVKEISGKERHKIFAYTQYLKLLSL